MKELSISIVAYNRREELRLCLLSIFQQRNGLDPEVIVFDNNSSDGTADMVADEFPEVKLIRGTSNLGLVKAINRSLAHCSGRFLVLLNDDTLVRPNALKLLLDFMKKNEGVGMASSKLLYPDGSVQLVARNFPTPINFFFGRQSLLTRWFPNNPFSRKYLRSEDAQRKEPFEVDWLSLACVIVRRELMEQMGGLDEDYFIYWIDADFCRRIKEKGWKIFCVPEAEVIHLEENKAGSKRNPKGIIDFHRGVYLYYTKHHLKSPYSPMRLLALGLLAFRAGVLLLVNAFRKKRPPFLKLDDLKGAIKETNYNGILDSKERS